MKKRIILALLSTLLSYPALCAAAGSNPFERGQGTFFDVPLMKIPMGSEPESRTSEKAKETDEKTDEEKQQSLMDKKVDDAIKKAWEEK